MAELQTCEDFFANEEPGKVYRILLCLLWDGALENAPSHEDVREWLDIMLARPDRAAMVKSIEEIHEYLGSGSP